ncbi:MAG TPA: phospholipase D-like domain-containing protein [Pyrinomonadaceae bacterium]|nr:phospholipase D-like domain-containing protein [Pyrinomonadaceae bacterium]
MGADTITRYNPEQTAITKEFVDETITRVTGAPLVAGNDVRLLVDATENYPAWLEAIASAERRILFESYIIHEDEQGELFAEALIRKAHDGVEVKLIYDWMGGVGATSRRYWRHLRQNGIEVRCYNPPKLTDPLGFFSRDHRKSMVVDGKIAFVSGLCVGKDWVGNKEKNIEPWRDTGVGIVGPAAADVEEAFAEVWATIGTPLDLLVNNGHRGNSRPDGIGVRVVQSVPSAAHIYRMDQILAATARKTMWLTDAYFVGLPSYLQSLKDAADDGVDVRILVPQSTDLPLIRDTTRSTYRPLLEAGVRVFEWNGPMVHAKTAVFDGRFARVGSSNLNIASWFGNYELDVFIQDESFGREMNEMFLKDLGNATEIVVTLDTKKPKPLEKHKGRKRGGSVRKATAGAINAATSISSAIAKKAPLGAAEARLLFVAGGILVGYAILLTLFPRGASVPLVAILLLLGIPTLIKALRNYRDY